VSGRSLPFDEAAALEERAIVAGFSPRPGCSRATCRTSTARKAASRAS